MHYYKCTEEVPIVALNSLQYYKIAVQLIFCLIESFANPSFFTFRP